jgi:hypothetical protein
LADEAFAKRRPDDRREIWEEVEAASGYSQEDRARILEELCDLAAELVSQHEDPVRTLAYQEPLSDDSVRLLGRLRAKYGKNA